MAGLLPNFQETKAQAQGLREALAQDGHAISHAQALDLVAKSHGYQDWNTLHAAIGNRPQPPLMLGQRAKGHYLKQPFLAKVIGIRQVSEGWYDVTLDLDEAVDVVTFDSFSNFRKRITKMVGAEGRSFDCTSDGVPHLILTL